MKTCQNWTSQMIQITLFKLNSYTKHAQSLQTLLSFHGTINTYLKTDFASLRA